MVIEKEMMMEHLKIFELKKIPYIYEVLSFIDNIHTSFDHIHPQKL